MTGPLIPVWILGAPLLLGLIELMRISSEIRRRGGPR